MTTGECRFRFEVQYRDDDIGFSFDLPDGWRRDEHNITTTFYGPNGGRTASSEVIQLTIGGILPRYLDPTEREKFLIEAGAEVLRTDIGGERNAVMLKKTTNSEISIVRDGVHYIFSYSNDAETQAAIERIRHSVQFPSREKAVEAIRQSSDPKAQGIEKALRAGSPEAARAWLAAAGAPGIRTEGGTLHYVGEAGGNEHHTTASIDPKASSDVPELPVGDSLTARLSDLEKQLDTYVFDSKMLGTILRERRERRRAEQQFIALGQSAVGFLLQSVDSINQNLLKTGPESYNIGRLERRVRILGQIKDVRATKAIITAVADAAEAVKTLKSQLVYDGGDLRAAKALRRTGIKALGAIGEPALPIIDSLIGYASLPAAEALWRAGSCIRKSKKWWQF